MGLVTLAMLSLQIALVISYEYSHDTPFDEPISSGRSSSLLSADLDGLDRQTNNTSTRPKMSARKTQDHSFIEVNYCVPQSS